MNKTFALLVALLFSAISISLQAQKPQPVDCVNTLMGTDSEFKLSNGNTYPAIALPWGMNFWTPQTAKMGDGWVYGYDANKIQGFKQTGSFRFSR
jgi:putative alpha-1,2-mannosidase